MEQYDMRYIYLDFAVLAMEDEVSFVTVRRPSS